MTNRPRMSPMDQPGRSQLDWELMARYVVGECTPEEAALVQRQLQEHSEDARIIAAIAERTATLRATPPADLDVEGALAKVHAARMAEGNAVRVLPFKRNRWLAPSIGVLAAAAAFVAMAVIIPRFKNESSSDTASAPSAGRVYATAVGQRDSMLLSDGTTVIMGPDTRLTLSADYNRTNRIVELQGVAFFNVRHDPSIPFTVHDGSAVVQDVGTVFAVSDEGDGTVTVAVLEGVVQLGAQQGTPVEIRAGDRAVINPKGDARVAYGAMTDSDLAWMHGRLEFRDAPLTKVAADLKR